MTEDEVLEMLRRACADAGSQQAWADGAGLSLQYVNDVLRGRRHAGAAILAALGVERVVSYEPATRRVRR